MKAKYLFGWQEGIVLLQPGRRTVVAAVGLVLARSDRTKTPEHYDCGGHGHPTKTPVCPIST